MPDIYGDYSQDAQLWGDTGPWVSNLGHAWRACATDEIRVEPPSSPFSAPPPSDGSYPGAWGAWYFGPLLHLLTYGLGWARPDLGLDRWLRIGRPDDSRILRVVDQWWGDELEPVSAWMSQEWQMVQTLPSRTAATGEAPGRATFSWRLREPRWQKIWGGGYDPMHLISHTQMPVMGGVPKGTLFISHPSSGVRSLIMSTPSYAGWYPSLMSLADGVSGWREGDPVDVFCPAIGWLGRFRRSDETGLWHRGWHRVHLLGNLPPSEDARAVRPWVESDR